MIQPRVKYGFLVVIIFQMGMIFYMLHAYNQLVNNQESYYQNFSSLPITHSGQSGSTDY